MVSSGSFSKKPLAKIGHFALRKKGREKTQLAKRWMVDLWEKKHFNLQSVKLTFLSFFQYKACILTFFMPCKMWNMFKVNNKDTKICIVNNKVKNKDTIDIVLPSLLLTLNISHFLLQCFYCWLSSVNCWLGLLFVIQMFCACWNQFS